MRHFVQIKQEIRDGKINGKKGQYIYVYPDFVASAKDLMKKGGKFYAVLNRSTGMWTTDEGEPLKIIDEDIREYVRKTFTEDNKGNYISFGPDGERIPVKMAFADSSSTNTLKNYNSWFQGLPSNNHYVQLDTEITFKDDEVTPDMYRSKRLPYNVRKGSIDA